MAQANQHQVGTLLAELISGLKAYDAEFNPMAFNVQYVDGQDRKCCRFCGHCPGALAERLETVIDLLTEDSDTKSRPSKAHDTTNLSEESI